MKRFNIIILLLIALLQIKIEAATSEADSLKNLLKTVHGEERSSILIDLIKEIQRTEPEAAMVYLYEVQTLLKNFPDNEKQIEVLNLKGWTYFFMDEFDSAKTYAEQTGELGMKYGIGKGIVWESLLKARILRDEEHYEEAINELNKALSENEDEVDDLLKAKILNEMGSVYRRLSNYNEALDYHKQALEILKSFNDEDELTTTYTLLGILNSIIGKYDEALKYHQSALELNEKQSDVRGIAGSIHNIGILYQKIGKYDKALEYYDNALKYWNRLNQKDPLASTLNSIGAVYELLEKYPEALNYYQQALAIWEETGSRNSISIGLNNIGSVYETLGNYKEAQHYLSRAIDIRKNIGDKNGTASSMTILSAVYNKLGNADLAIKTGKESVRLANETGSWSTIREAHIILSEIYESNGRFEEALEEYKNYKAAHDSMFNSESTEVIEELEAKYKTVEQQRQIAILQRDNEIQTLYKSILWAGLTVAIIILILLYSRYRLKHRSHLALQKLHESEMEAAQTKSAMLQMEFDLKKKELDAARALQLSMLPSKIPDYPGIEIAASMLTATEVGGDYYDFYNSTDGSLTIVIGDATGHGAQAGTIVTATKSLFNLLSREENIAEILNHINFSLKKMQLPNLFMTMGVVRLTDHTMELAGAGMPAAMIYRASSSIVETIPLKGLPLGSVADFSYSKISVKLNSGDVVALMSDGLPELFNEKYEMFGYENVSRLFEEGINNPPEKIIEHFTNFAAKWLNGRKQQDDMTFIVFKKI